MPFPSHIAAILDRFGIPPHTKAELYDLYIAMGDEALEAFAELTDEAIAPDTAAVRRRVVERYLRRNHPKWLAGSPTASLWHPRELEGRASGAAVPLGPLSDAARAAIGPRQPVPDGIAILGRNAHFGGRIETVSFDVVPAAVDDAIAVATAAGQQHTIPGSVGETSGTFDARHRIALVWEVQPNVYKPSAERNRSIAKIYRRHRNWHLATLATALEWLRAQKCTTYVLRGAALAPTHEVNPNKPVSEAITAHHDRTVAQVASSLGLQLGDVSFDDEFLLLESIVMNHALRRHVLEHGAAGAMWKVNAE